MAVPVPLEAGFFLVAWAVEWLADARATDGTMGIDKALRRLRKIERRHGVEDGLLPWPPGEEPPEWLAANREWERIFIDCLRTRAAGMADLFVDDRDEFDRRREIGRANFARLVGRDDILQPIEDNPRDTPVKA